MDLCILRPNMVVESLAVNVQGKCDKQPVTLTLWADHKMPTLCPIRHLLLYVKLLGAKSGFLFPTRKELENLKYYSYLQWYKATCQKLIQRKGPFGTHCNRKTGYLLAVWAKAVLQDIMAGARHKTQVCAEKYRRDALTLLHIHQAKNQQMPGLIWKPIYIADIQMARGVLDDLNKLPLDRLADIFFDTHMKLDQSSAGIPSKRPSMLPLTLLDPTVLEQISEVMKTVLHPATSAELFKLIELYALQSRYQDPSESNDTGCSGNQDSSPSIHKKQKAPPTPERVISVQKKKRGGDREIPGRLTLSRKKSGAEKLDALIEMQADFDSRKVADTELGNRARTFRQTVIKPILGCWVNHFDSDKDAFIEKYGDFSHSMFHASSCKGHGSQCSTAVKERKTPNENLVMRKGMGAMAVEMEEQG
ncbi:hypothetical protein HDU97_008341 [Phlyctochytrium planicorne]|nr:hypothetical protein HDU97_008341 [Phlyctochytrium planicorne]